VSAEASSSVCLVPPVRFGRRAQVGCDLHGEVSAGRVLGQAVPVSWVGDRSCGLSVVVDDPAGVAEVLRERMDPADLMELVVILAEAMAEVLRQRNQDGEFAPYREARCATSGRRQLGAAT
jgi:hypothetical protein